MSKSDDVTKLFAMFGEKNTDQYQEIYEAEQNQATRDRWPVFQRINVQADTPAEPPPPARAVPKSAPLPRPFKPVTQQSQKPMPNKAQGASMPKAQAAPPETAPAKVTTTVPAPESQQPRAPASPEQSDERSGDLHALFQRLERLSLAQEEPTEPEPIPAPTVEPEPRTDSIRSLFNRLSR